MDPLLVKLGRGDVSNIIPEVKAALNGISCSALAHKLLVKIANLTIKKESGSSEPILSNNEETLQLVQYCANAILSDTPAAKHINLNTTTLIAVVNILTRFRLSNDTLSAVRMLNTFLPILDEMSSSFIELGDKYNDSYFRNVYELLTRLNDNLYKEGDKTELSPLHLWDLMLHVSSLLKSCSLKYILSTMRSMVTKFGKLHVNDAEKICAFNSALVEKLLKYSETNSLNAVGEETEVDKVFGILVLLLWQLLTSDLKMANIANAYLTLSRISKFVSSSFANQSYHMECFKIIARLFKAFQFPIHCLPEKETFISEVQALLKILQNWKEPMRSPFAWVVFIAGSALSSMDQLTRGPGLKSFFSTAVLSSIHHFAQTLTKFLLSSSTALCVGDDGKVCPFEGDASLAFRSVKQFILLCIGTKKDKEEWSEVLPMIKDSCDNLELIIRKAKEGKCVKEQYLTTSLCDIYARLGQICYSTSNWDYGLSFLEWQTKLLYPADAITSATNAQKLTSILPRLSVCYENLQLKKQAKLALVLGVILNFKCSIPQTQQGAKFLQDKWVLLQNEESDGKTADKLLNKTLLKSMCPQFKLCEEIVPQIMLWELSCYAGNRMKSTDIIINAWLTLKGSKPSSLQLLEGSALACQALFYSNDLVNWYDLLSASISTFLSQVRPGEKAVALCSMGAHYHIKFLIAAQNHFDENYTKVEEVKVYCKNPASIKKPQDVCDPADVCQVQSSFPNLNLHREQKLMDLLDAAVNYWSSSLEIGLSIEDYISSPIVVASGDYLLHVAFLYSLWGHNSAAAKAFQVCCTFARKMSLDDLLLQALSGLMNTIEVSKEYILEAESLMEQLKNHNKISYFKKVYSTSRAFQALRTGSLVSEGAKVLEDIIDCSATPSTQWCYAYAKTLQASYQRLPSMKHVNSKKGGSDLVRDGLATILQNIQDRRLSHSPLTYAAVVDQTLRSSLWIGRYYLHRHMPREARSYLAAELIIALKLGLATRAAEFICELALVDLLTENVDEAAAKTYDLKCILDAKDSSENDFDDNTSKSDEIFSSSLVPKHTGTNLGASPNLEKNETFEIPILKHGLSCTCYMCRNVSVQIIWLMYGRIQAKIYALRFFVHDSYATYKKIFKSADVIINRLCENALSGGASLQQHQLTYTLICSKLDFTDMLVMYEKDEDAERENKRIFALLKNLQIDENNLEEDTEEQQVCIAEMLKEVQGKGKSPRVRDRTPEAITKQSTSPSIFVDKTPERKDFVSTPVGPGKKRHPLKLVEPSNHLIVPLNDKQFFSPKVSRGLENLIGSDDDGEVFISVPSKENVTRVPRNVLKTSCIKSEFLDKAKVASCSPDGQDNIEDIKNVTINKVSKIVQPSKPPSMNETYSVNGTFNVTEKHPSSLRPTSKTLPVTVNDCQDNVGGVKNVSTNKLSKSGRPSKPKTQSSCNETYSLDVTHTSSSKTLPVSEKAPSSRRITSKTVSVDEKPPSSRRITSKTLPVDGKPPSSRVTSSGNEKAPSSARVVTKSKALPLQAAESGTDSVCKETIASVQASTRNTGASASSLAAKNNLKCAKKVSTSSGRNLNNTEQLKDSETRASKLSSDVPDKSVEPSIRQTRQRKR